MKKCAGVAQLVEQRFCKPQVVGSSPFSSSMVEIFEERFPSGQRDQTVNLAAYAFEGSNPSLSTSVLRVKRVILDKRCAGVAQLARASAFQAEGRGFESRLPLQICMLL